MNEPMNEIVVLDARVVTGSGGGPEKTILNSPRFLTGTRYRMLCVYLRPPGDPGFRDIENRAAKLNAPLIAISDRGAWDHQVVWDLLALCRRENVAIWHGHDYKTNALGLLLAWFHPMRLLTTVHGWVRHTKRTPLYYAIDRLTLPYYEKVFSVSEDLFESCRKARVRPSRSVLLENGIDEVDYRRSQTTNEAKQKLGLAQQGFLIGAVGRLSPEKGFDLLIQAVADLRNQGVSLRLAIVGEGEDRSRLEAIIREQGLADFVTLTGWRSDVRDWYEAFDLFVLSSYREGLPNVVLEAMALEVPVIATRIAGVPKLLDGGNCGRLIAAGDLRELTESIASLVADGVERERLRAAARERIVTHYSFARRMEKMVQVYDDVMAS